MKKLILIIIILIITGCCGRNYEYIDYENRIKTSNKCSEENQVSYCYVNNIKIKVKQYRVIK